MLLEILRALESLSAEFALVWLQGNVHANMRGDVIALDCSGAALAPGAGQVEVVGRLATDVALANVLLDNASVDAINLSDARNLHREPLGMRIARRSPAIGTANSRLRPRLTRLVER
jgi:hypothetical protein